jgi:hypothetical protein
MPLAVNRVTPADIKQYFEENLSQGSEVYLPEDSGYATEITQRWNTLEPPTYLVAVKPATDTDVLEVVCADHHQCHVATRANSFKRSNMPLIKAFHFWAPVAAMDTPSQLPHWTMALTLTWVSSIQSKLTPRKAQ